jgi:rod shape determining protein RodA
MMRFDRQLIANAEWFLPAVTFALCGLGLASLYSATYEAGAIGVHPLVARQLAWLGAGIFGMLVVVAIDYRTYERFSYVLYAFAVLLLLVVPFVGVVGGGARRWIRFGSFTLQPSEPMKILLIIVLARYLSRAHATVRGLDLKRLVVPLLLTAIPAAAILLQPDLGTVVVILVVFASMAFVAGARLAPFVTVFVITLASGPVLWNYLKPYQQQRIMTFLNPERDPLGAGYHIIQSRIAVGSGQFWGKGFLQGTQNQLDFLPEQHTDFIFSVFAEEWGFAGAAGLLILYLVLLARGFVIVTRARDSFGALVCVGILSMIFWQVLVNVGMTTGLFPVVGIPLPFFSYGGSSLLSLLVGVGLIMNIQMRKFTFSRGMV